MKKITSREHLKEILDTDIYQYIQNLLEYYLKEYSQFCPDSSIEEIGAIFLLEQETDFSMYQEMGLSSPITESCFEWVETVEHGYCNGCIVIDNDRAINIIGKQEYFNKLKERSI